MPPCDGRLVRTHLIPRQLIGRVVDAPRFAEVVDDPRSFVIACGGPLGNAGHHGHLDSSRRLRVPRDRIPQGTGGSWAWSGGLSGSTGDERLRSFDGRVQPPDGASGALIRPGGPLVAAHRGRLSRLRLVRDDSMTRLCACACGQPLPAGMRADARYLAPTHQRRALRARKAFGASNMAPGDPSGAPRALERGTARANGMRCPRCGSRHLTRTFRVTAPRPSRRRRGRASGGAGVGGRERGGAASAGWSPARRAGRSRRPGSCCDEGGALAERVGRLAGGRARRRISRWATTSAICCTS